MQNAVIVDAVRTPVGKRNGKLTGWHPVDLAAHSLKALVERNDLDPGLVDELSRRAPDVGTSDATPPLPPVSPRTWSARRSIANVGQANSRPTSAPKVSWPAPTTS